MCRASRVRVGKHLLHEMAPGGHRTGAAQFRPARSGACAARVGRAQRLTCAAGGHLIGHHTELGTALTLTTILVRPALDSHRVAKEGHLLRRRPLMSPMNGLAG